MGKRKAKLLGGTDVPSKAAPRLKRTISAEDALDRDSRAFVEQMFREGGGPDANDLVRLSKKERQQRFNHVVEMQRKSGVEMRETMLNDIRTRYVDEERDVRCQFTVETGPRKGMKIEVILMCSEHRLLRGQSGGFLQRDWATKHLNEAQQRALGIGAGTGVTLQDVPGEPAMATDSAGTQVTEAMEE